MSTAHELLYHNQTFDVIIEKSDYDIGTFNCDAKAP